MSQINKEYKTQTPGEIITSKQLAKAAPEKQKEVMEVWFRQNFIKPKFTELESGSMISHFFGYDFYPLPELVKEFRDEIPYDIIKPHASKLYGESPMWTSAEGTTDPDVDYFSSIFLNVDFYKNFLDHLRNVESIIKVKLNIAAKQHLFHILHVSVITAIETYLYLAFQNCLKSSETIKMNFVRQNDDFKKREKFPFSTVYEAVEQVDIRLEKYLDTVSWHNLQKVKKLYTAGLCETHPDNRYPFVFPDESDLMPYVHTRHDIVHRSGLRKDKTEATITENSIADLIRLAKSFVKEIQEQIRHIRNSDPPQDTKPAS